MSQICIRRTKEMQNSKGEYLVPLPPVEMTLIPVQLDTQTRVSVSILRGTARLSLHVIATYHCSGVV